MNCEYVDQLLPLYIGRDLEEESSRLVAAHLLSCTECARTADEYAGANRLLQEFEPPPFSRAVYAGIRRQVLNEIERTSQAPAWTSVLSQLFGPLIQPRAMWITATLLLPTLLAASYFIIYRSQLPNGAKVVDRSRDHDQDAKHASAGTQTETDQSMSSSSSKSSEDFGSVPAAGSDKRVVTSRPGSGYRSRQRESAIVAAAQPRELIPRTSGTGVEASPDVSQTSSAPALLRVEMQTSDPNIRIIWLSRQHSPNGPKDTSKGI